jgi:hypothetical protein
LTEVKRAYLIEQAKREYDNSYIAPAFVQTREGRGKSGIRIVEVNREHE